MRTVMLEVETFPGQVPGLPAQAVAAGSLLPPRLARMEMSFDRLAVRSAAEQHLPSAPGLYALWGRMSDGAVLGLHQVDDATGREAEGQELHAAGQRHAPTLASTAGGGQNMTVANRAVSRKPTRSYTARAGVFQSLT